MKNLQKIENMTKIPNFLSEEWIDKALKKLDKTKMTLEERMQYEMTMARNASIDLIQEERDARVTEEVTEDVTKKMAKKLKDKGMPTAEIAEITGLEIKIIETL